MKTMPANTMHCSADSEEISNFKLKLATVTGRGHPEPLGTRTTTSADGRTAP